MALVVAAAIFFGNIDRPDLLPQALLIIGLHFLPLGRIFRAPLYYWTGTAMTLAAPLSFMIPRGYTRNIACCAAEGLALWITCVIILRRIARRVAEPS